MEKHIFLVILVFLVQNYKITISAASSNETDQNALLAFKNIVASSSPFLAKNWTMNTSFCNWFGVTCSPKGQRVVALTIPNMNLQGTISPSLANLSFLTNLNLTQNYFHGSIPTGIFRHRRIREISLAFNKLDGELLQGPWYVPHLKALELSNNGLTGPVPASLFNISSLLSVILANNSLSGPLFLGEGNILSNMKILAIANNQISGQFPPNICQLKQLKVLSMYNNNMTGEIPRNIDCLAKLESLDISGNAISGTIPTSIGNVSTLRHLQCSLNQIEGHIPPELEKLSALRWLLFYHNNLVGEIPKGIFNISSLEMISLPMNNLSGGIPIYAALRFPNLKELYLGDNQLQGEIPPHITNASKLTTLSLAYNFFTGFIPSDLGNLRDLRILELGSNWLINEPSKHELQFLNSLMNCRALEVVSVTYNPLTGVLPNSIQNLSSSIQDFEIGFANISGHIPEEIGNMSNLFVLSIEGNNLMGSIPPEIGKLKHLQGLYAGSNKLKKQIPAELCHLSNLAILNLENNELSGAIPSCVGNISKSQPILLGSNKLVSKLPLSLLKLGALLNLNLSLNSLHGEIPSEIGQLKAIVQLDLSSNHFSGNIPSTLGDLQNLLGLYLSNNSFIGSIPLSFANLVGLEDLDLSSNSLSGSIPKSLEKLTSLKIIDVSFNDLEGEIPSGGVFANSTPQFFLGNKGLCGMQILGVPACIVANNPGGQSKSKKHMLKIVIPVVIVCFLIFLSVSIWIIKQKRKVKTKDQGNVLETGTYQLVSYHEIRRATNDFDGSNLIATGGSGCVYRGTLASGMVVAIKVLDLQNREACKRFDTECEVLRNVRHRNLVPVITTCSSEYIRAFVLPYMPNGSLENWLYKEDRHLNLLQRVTVMLDVAMAIEYLHHGFDVPVVHRDLKPANILLDENMVAHVTDFGISKILAVNKSKAQTETLGTVGYIAPEYGLEGVVSTSGDVYSYGIILMEVLTRRRPTDEIFHENLGLRQWIERAFPKTVMEVVDVNLFHEEEGITFKSEICIASMIELALDSTQERPDSRITMNDVVKRLTKIRNTFLKT